jgi:hypothetical protein
MDLCQITNKVNPFPIKNHHTEKILTFQNVLAYLNLDLSYDLKKNNTNFFMSMSL